MRPCCGRPMPTPASVNPTLNPTPHPAPTYPITSCPNPGPQPTPQPRPSPTPQKEPAVGCTGFQRWSRPSHPRALSAGRCRSPAGAKSRAGGPPAARASTPAAPSPPAPNRPRCVPSGGHRLGERARRARTRGRAEPPSVRVATSVPRARAGPRPVACRAELRRLRCSTSGAARAARAEAPPVARRGQRPVLLFSLPP